MTRLETVEIEGTHYYVDERLHEFRNVDNPHDAIRYSDMQFAMALMVAKGILAPFDDLQGLAPCPFDG